MKKSIPQGGLILGQVGINEPFVYVKIFALESSRLLPRIDMSLTGKGKHATPSSSNTVAVRGGSVGPATATGAGLENGSNENPLPASCAKTGKQLTKEIAEVL